MPHIPSHTYNNALFPRHTIPRPTHTPRVSVAPRPPPPRPAGNPVLVIGQQDGTIVLRDVAEGIRKPAAVLKWHTADVRVVLAGPSGYFFSGGTDGRFCVWELLAPAPALADGTAPGGH